MEFKPRSRQAEDSLLRVNRQERSVQRSVGPDLSYRPVPLLPNPHVTPRQLHLQRSEKQLTDFTVSPVTAQRQALAPVFEGLQLQRDLLNLEGPVSHRQSLQRQIEDHQASLGAPQLQAGQYEAAVQRQADLQTPVGPLTQRPGTPAQWSQGGQWEVQRVAHPDKPGQTISLREHEQSQHLGVLRTVGTQLGQGFRTDTGPAVQRYAEYGEALAPFQRLGTGTGRAVVTTALMQVPVSQRQALQRAIDNTIQCQQAQETQDRAIIGLHSLQRQLEHLHGQSEQPVVEQIQARRGSGNPIPTGLRKALELELNHDLGAVRIHDDAEADHLAKKVNAVAFTTGQDIFFRAGTFNPNTRSGVELLAHEVTHTKQQAQGRAKPGIDADAGLEQEAVAMGSKLATLKLQGGRSGLPRSPASSAQPSAGAVQRTGATTSMNAAINAAPPQSKESGWLAQLGQSVWQAAYEAPLYAAGTVAGVVEGFFGNIWENIQALGAVASMAYGLVRDVFTGQLTSRMGEMTKWLQNLSWEAVKSMASGLGGQLKAQILAQAKAWVQPDPFKRGEAQGKVMGMILGEVAIVILTDGALMAVKNGLKATGAVSRLVGKIPGTVELVAGVRKKQAAFKALVVTAKTATTKVLKSLIPEAWLKRLGSRGVLEAERALGTADAKAALKEAGQKARQLPTAIALSVGTVLANDLINAPVGVVLAELNLMKARFGWIRGFEARRTGATFSFDLVASRINIYNGYTNQHKPDMEFETIPYGMSLSDVNKKRVAQGLAALEKHHGVMDEWAKTHLSNLGYVSGHAPSMTLTEAQHEATKKVYREWLRKKYGSPVGVSPDWAGMTSKEAQALTDQMFGAARVPQAARDEYFRAWHLYIYTKLK